jgi:hypothetical protein
VREAMGVKEDWKLVLLNGALIAVVAFVLLVAKVVGMMGASLYLLAVIIAVVVFFWFRP